MRKLIVLFFGLFVSGCTVYRQPIVQPFGDADYWVLRESMTYEIGKTNESIVIPKGFVTDFASTPYLVQPFLPKLGRHLIPAIVHDYLYWNQSCTREQADKIFDFAMKDAGVKDFTRKIMMVAVENFGGKAWRQNSEKKSDGHVKVIPSSNLDIPINVTWEVYSRQLKIDGVEDGDSGKNFSSSCSVINSL